MSREGGPKMGSSRDDPKGHLHAVPSLLPPKGASPRALERWYEGYRNDPRAAGLEIEGFEAEVGTVLAHALAIDASVLSEVLPPNDPGLAEQQAMAARVRRAWVAYHGGDPREGLAELKQRALVEALERVPREVDESDWRASVLLTRLAKIDPSYRRDPTHPFARTVDPQLATDALAVWPPKRGQPRK